MKSLTLKLHISKVMKYILSGESYADFMFLDMEFISLKKLDDAYYSFEIEGPEQGCREYLQEVFEFSEKEIDNIMEDAHD